MRKRILLAAVMAAAVLVLGLAGCSSQSEPSKEDQESIQGLPAWADEGAITEQARSAIDLFTAGDYEGLVALFGDPKPDVSAFKKAAETIDGVGDFGLYGEVSYGHFETESDGTAAIVTQLAQCRNGQLIYSVGLAENGKLVGFHVK